MSNPISLPCLVLVDNTYKLFVANICDTESVYMLKKCIWKQHRNSLNGIDAGDLELWKLNDPIDSQKDNFDKEVRERLHDPNFATLLTPVGSISKYFSAPFLHTHIYLIAQSRDVPLPSVGDAIRTSIAIVMSPTNMTKPTRSDVDANDITPRVDPIHLDDLPDNVKLFARQLTGKVPYTLDNGIVKNFVEILKGHLGDGGFKDQFTDEADKDRAAANWRELVSYCNAIGRFKDGIVYYNEFTALANEVCFGAVIADPAIETLGNAYNRGILHAYIELKSSDTGKLVDIWYPRNDFSIAFEQGGLGYALLHGATETDGHSEMDAMHKNALLCHHSWKVRHEIYYEIDPVILYAYVSRSVCSMYIFFKDKSEFKFWCILKEKDLFTSMPKIVEFLRLLHNFSVIAKRYQLEKVAEKLRRDLLKYLDNIPAPPSSSEQSDEGSTKESLGNRMGEELDGPRVRSMIGALGYTKYTAWPKHGFMILHKSKERYAAKRTDSEEFGILEYLKSVSNPTYRNHTIPILDTLPLGEDYFLIIMPYYRTLRKFEALSKEEYYNIRFQLVEGIAFLHDQGIVHSDIKPENLVFDSATNILYVIDYDLARRHRSGKLRITEFIGTEDYTAPEVKYSSNWDPMPADVWAMAKTLGYLAKLAGVDDSLLSLALSSDPSLRPTAVESFAIIQRWNQRKRHAEEPQEERSPKRPALEVDMGHRAICEN